jgi:hypothetical protein
MFLFVQVTAARDFFSRLNQMDNYSFLKVLSTCISIQLQQHCFFSINFLSVVFFVCSLWQSFQTKFSLSKFISLINRLTVKQRKLVSDIGFENLLYITCDYIPRGIISFLVSNFDSQSRSLHLPNGSTICIDAVCINTIQGTTIGGKVIGEIVDQDLRRTISELTKCKGNYPTIS